MWWAIGLAALYVMHRISRPSPAPPAMRTPMIEGAWKGATVDLNPFWADEGGPANPFLLKLPTPSVPAPTGLGGGGGSGGGGAGGGGGGAGGGGARLK